VDQFEKRLHRVEKFLFGNGEPGVDELIRALKGRDKEVQAMIREWNEWKAGWKGVRLTLIGVGVVLTLLGGGLGTAILVALRQVAAALP